MFNRSSLRSATARTARLICGLHQLAIDTFSPCCTICAVSLLQVLDLAAAAATGSAPCVVERLSARCTHGATGVCSRPAVFSQRLSMTAKEGDESVVAIGGGERYQPACELHHVPHAVPYDAWYSDAAAQLRDDALR